jgi:carotenoid cleavage dioxygenase
VLALWLAIGSQSEDDGYLITLVSDMNRDLSECLVFDAQQMAAGPIARVRLPEPVSSGTHATWAAGAMIPGWREHDEAATALKL